VLLNVSALYVSTLLGGEIHYFAVLPILGRIRGVKLIEFNLVPGEIGFVASVKKIHQFTGRDAFLARVYFNGSSVGVRRADVHHVATGEAQETHKNIRLHVFHEMTDVDVSVGVRQGAGDKY
jgi:hypothetical protein